MTAAGDPEGFARAEEHRRTVRDQFTRQAAPFSRMTGYSDELLLAATGVGPGDTVLDLACGPGLTACPLTAVARHVTGIDLTPAMIDRARALQREKGLGNLSWVIGDVRPLPFPDGAFSLVFTRYSFHHVLDPAGVLAEMVRVASPEGRVVVVDAVTSGPDQSRAFNEWERLRDPSHVRALGLDELAGLFREAGLRGLATQSYRHEFDLEAVLGSSFPAPGDEDRLRQLVVEDVGVDRLGFGARRDGASIRIAYPCAVVSGRKA